MEKKTRKRVIVYCILFVGLIVGITVVLFPYIDRLSDPQSQNAIEALLEKKRVMGLLVVLDIQILQVVIAFIPGEPVEIFSGVIWNGGRASYLLVRVYDSFNNYIRPIQTVRKAASL